MSLVQRTVRLPQEFWDRSERLIEVIKENEENRFVGDLNVSKVIRAAVREGLDLLEQRFGAAEKG